jgi:2-iminobutanoate/2-iminopropanoate deaminase
MNRTTSDGRTVISTPDAPAAIGPYSQAIVAGGFVHCSGQIALDPKTMQIVEGDVKVQTERVLKNLAAVLAAAGTSLAKVVKCNVYLSDMGSFTAMNEVYARFFTGEAPPARATVAVKTLPKNVDVEIDCLAIL